jgi:hypothetical protein
MGSPPGDIFQTGNKELNDFVFASEMAKMLQQVRS